MKNFTPHFDQRTHKVTSYKFFDVPEGEAIKLSVTYQKADMLTHQTKHGGVYVHITPVTLERANGMLFITQTLFMGAAQSGAKVRVWTMDRKSMKAVEQVAMQLDELAPSICAMFRVDPQTAFNAIREIFSSNVAL